MPLVTTVELANAREADVVAVNTFLHDAFLQLRMRKAGAGKVVTVEPFDPTFAGMGRG
jgi:hypothetical protein